MTSIVKVECGSIMDNFYNTSFFNVIKHGLMIIDHPAQNFSYERFWEIGDWSNNSLRGDMIDTCKHDYELNTMAKALGVHIVVYIEIGKSLINLDVFQSFGDAMVLGKRTPTIRVVKVFNCEHFNYLESFKNIEMTQVYRQEFMSWCNRNNMTNEQQTTKTIHPSVKDYFVSEINATLSDIKSLNEDITSVQRTMFILRKEDMQNDLNDLYNRRKDLESYIELLLKKL
jgi:hypothetical protein